MYCTSCRSEYREGYTECADCKVPLVESLPINAPRSGRVPIWISRLSLAIAGFSTLMSALSFPAPSDATLLSIAIQTLYCLVSVASFVALFRIGRTRKSGRRLVALLGLAAPFMLAFNARATVAGLRHEFPLSPLTSLIGVTPWIALLIAAACSIRPQSGVDESTPIDDPQGER